MKGISIILCCFNSEDRLPETLQHLANQRLPRQIPAEVVLVDNASTDATVERARQLWSTYPTAIDLRVVSESQPGHIFARITGARQARYEMVVFCDDDNWLTPDYLDIAWNRLSQNPMIGAIGGKGEAISDHPFPVWFAANQSGYACGEQWPHSGVCSQRMYLWGAGLVSRKSILEQVFHPDYPLLLTGRKEHTVTSGDDMEISKRILLLGYELYYDSSLIYKHCIPTVRLSEQYLAQLSHSSDLAVPVQRIYSYLIIKQRFSAFFVPFLAIWHSLLFLFFKLGLPVGRRKPIINFFKVYTQGICKTGRYHNEYQQVKAFTHYAHTIL